MKIRNGFVSNSSSSNFIVIGRPAKLNEIKDDHVMFLGRWLGDGQDWFRPDPEMISYMLEFGIPENDIIDLIYVIKTFREDGSMSLQEIKDLAKEMEKDPNLKSITFYALETDYHPTNDMEYFKSRYYPEE